MPLFIFTEVLIKDNGIEYKVVWWNDGIRYNPWVSAVEIVEQEKMEVGFK